CPAEGDLEQVGAQAGHHRGVDRLPEGVTERVVVAVPERAADLDGDDAVLQCLGVLARPDATLIVLDHVIEARARAARPQQQDQGTPACDPGWHVVTLGTAALSRRDRAAYTPGALG